MEDAYVDVPGDVVFYEDFKHTNTLTYHYLVKGNLASQQALCDSWLNVHWQQKYKFTPYHPFLLISFVNASCRLGLCERKDWCDTACSNGNCSQSMLLDENRKPLGYFKFNLLSVNMMVTGMGKKPMLFSPYTFCDDGTVTANYRELLGWNVLFSEFNFPKVPYGSNSQLFSFQCAMDVPRTQTYTEPPPLETFVELPALSDATMLDGEAQTRFSTIGQAMAGIPPYLYQQLTTRYGEGQSKFVAPISNAILGGAGRVSLRQFRGTVTGEKAICQSIQSFDAGDYQFKEGGIIPPGQVMHFPKTSDIAQLHFPLRQDLGLQDDAEVIAAFWTLADYSILPHSTNWTGIRRK